jgi:cytochrome c peroxidase
MSELNRRWNAFQLVGGLICVSSLMFAGCSAERTESGSAPAADADTTANLAKSADAQSVAESLVEALPSTNAESAATAPNTTTPSAERITQPQPADASSPASLPVNVVLGDDSLYAGIPGEGPLSGEELRQWLETPGVHEPLSISLPLGLSLGEQQLVGLDENPLTRAKIELGRQLYFDGRLSSDGSISCASCHDPAQGYATRTQFGVGIGGKTGNRNSPVSYNRILSGPQFWDGRADSLEAQAVGPIANPIEMANTHDTCVATIGRIEGYRMQFERIFGENSVTIDNVARAIASFERALVTGPSPYDYQAALKPFLDQFPTEDDLADLKEDDPELFAKYQDLKAQADAHPMSESAHRGRELFFSEKAGCTACHVGANFTDEKYHNLGVGMAAENPDLGRYVVTGEEKDKGAFKTPTVRNVAFTAPYMHDGSQQTLEEVVEWYAKGGHPNLWLSEKIKKLDLTDQDKQDLVAFMKALSGPFPHVETGRLPR